MDETGVHRIRLKGPWMVLPPASEDQAFQKHSMPQDWRSLFGNVAGTARYQRNFHTPTRLESHERVLIHIPSGVGELKDFKVNGIALTATSTAPLKFDVTQHLQDFNLLEFSLSFDPEKESEVPGGLWETVFIEIHSS